MTHEEYYEEECLEEEVCEDERDERCMYEERWWDSGYYEDARMM